MKIAFVNNKGRLMKLSGNLTLGDLTALGVKVRIVDKDASLADGWWRDTGEPLPGDRAMEVRKKKPRKKAK